MRVLGQELGAGILATRGAAVRLRHRRRPISQRLTIQGDPPKFTDKLADVLGDADIQAVAVATPAATHYEVVKQCLEAGKDVFVEKPLALNVEQGQELVALAEAAARESSWSAISCSTIPPSSSCGN